MHTFNLEDIQAAIVEDFGTGFCMECGTETSPVEPDAREYECQTCGEPAVFGAEQILLEFPEQVT